MSIDPRAPEENLIARVEVVAVNQLEEAIRASFRYGDPASIHTLAAAANGCYHALGAKQGIPTLVQAWINSLKPAERRAARKAQNFFKHGPDRGETEVHFRPDHAALLIMDSIISHEKLFKKRTPLMTCFFARFTFESPRLVEHINAVRRKEGRQDLVIEQAGDTDRMQFLNRELPAVIAAIAAGEGGSLHDLPP